MANAWGKPVALTAGTWTEINATVLQAVGGGDMTKPWLNLALWTTNPQTEIQHSYTEDGEGQGTIEEGGVWGDPLAGSITDKTFWVKPVVSTTLNVHITLGA